jgi:hypothetical protein
MKRVSYIEKKRESIICHTYRETSYCADALTNLAYEIGGDLMVYEQMSNVWLKLDLIFKLIFYLSFFFVGLRSSCNHEKEKKRRRVKKIK